MKKAKGFTLIELLMALAIFLIVITAAYATFTSQQKSYLVQEQIAGIQQNLRAGMYVMQRELRMAGYDPIPTIGVTPGIEDTTLSPDQITFSYIADDDGLDNDNDGNTDTSDELETVRYSLYTSQGRQNLGRRTGDPLSANSAIAENIDALNFVYLDGGGNPTSTPSSVVSVQITMVARGDRADLDWTDRTVYRNQRNDIILDRQDDNYHRRLLTTEVKCRNLRLP